jgi:hypothetical protein
MDFCVNGRGFASSLRRSIDTKIHLLYTSGKQKSIILWGRTDSLCFWSICSAASLHKSDWEMWQHAVLSGRQQGGIVLDKGYDVRTGFHTLYLCLI